MVFEWLYHSDTTRLHTGPPDYPRIPVPDWKIFEQDFSDDFFQGDWTILPGSVLLIHDPSTREDIGALCYTTFHLRPGAAELDIWLRSRAFLGQGVGPMALRLATNTLRNKCKIFDFLIRPAESNRRAVRSYEKAGFQIASNVEAKHDILRKFISLELHDQYNDGDYGFEDTAVLYYFSDDAPASSSVGSRKNIFR